MGLAKLIPLLRRKGELGKLPEILEEMDDMSSPGKSFCLGLADYYALRTERAMHHLIAAKRSPKWRIPALQTMIRLCLGLESEELNTDVDAVNLAAQLLAELPPNDIETKILSNWILLARNDKNSITEAMSGFHALEGLN